MGHHPLPVGRSALIAVVRANHSARALTASAWQHGPRGSSYDVILAEHLSSRKEQTVEQAGNLPLLIETFRENVSQIVWSTNSRAAELS
jgi:hypothetical protein